jgi:hypothetical protein
MFLAAEAQALKSKIPGCWLKRRMKDSAACNTHLFYRALYYELMLSLARRVFAMFSPLRNLISGVPFFVCSFRYKL